MAVIWESVGIAATLYSTSGSKPAVTIFACKKTKTAKDLFNWKISAIGIHAATASTLQVLYVEKKNSYI